MERGYGGKQCLNGNTGRYNYRSPARRIVESIVSVLKPNEVWEMDIKYAYIEGTERHTCLPSSTVTPGRLLGSIWDITAHHRM